jgi:hypothetical protein
MMNLMIVAAIMKAALAAAQAALWVAAEQRSPYGRPEENA